MYILSWSRIKKVWLYYLLGYVEIGGHKYGNCRHTYGDITFCLNREVTSQSRCEEFCSSFGSCLAYEYGVSGYNMGYCYLYPSDYTCPNDFELSEGENTAKSIDDLVSFPNSDFVCKGKNPGRKNILRILPHFSSGWFIKIY